jgi:hypothetical protein
VAAIKFPFGNLTNFHGRFLHLEVVSPVHPEEFTFDIPGLL